NEPSDRIDQSLVPFISATPNLVRLNEKWQEQLKTEKEQIRRGLITGNFDKDDDGILNLDAARSAVATIVTLNNMNINTKICENYGDNNGQLIMCIPGCGGTGKSQLIRALTKYFLVTKRIQVMRKLAPTGIAAAEID
ncbi:unnamed protein product, partial [Rotaria socialis]